MADWQLAQINVARLIADKDQPQVADFFADLDRINAIAEASAGFVWRLQDDAGNATDLQPTPDPRLIVNMSVWTDADALFDFVYRTAHTPVMGRRKSWFARFDGAYQALWWVPAGHRPTVEEGLSRLWMIDRYGSGAMAFTFKSRHPAPGTPGPVTDMKPDPLVQRLGVINTDSAYLVVGRGMD